MQSQENCTTTCIPVADTRLVERPPVDIREEDDALVLLVDLPGVSREDLDLKIHQGLLELTAPAPVLPERGTWLTREFGSRTLRRAFQLPDSVDPDQVSATLKDGVLTLRLGFTAERSPRRIQIREN